MPAEICAGNVACDVAVSYVAPTIGAILAFVVQISPIRAMLATHHTRKLPPSFNPYPLSIQLWNALLGMNYAMVILDWFVFVPNFTGFLLNLLFYGWILRSDLPEKKFNIMHSTTVVGLCSLAVLMNAIVNIQIVSNNRQQAQFVMGIICTISLTLFYASPLGTMKSVIQTKDSSSIFLPLTLTAGLGAAFWACYGFAVKDVWIWGPNIAGVALALIQCALALIYPRKMARSWFTMKRGNDADRLGKLPLEESSVTISNDSDLEIAAAHALKQVQSTSVCSPLPDQHLGVDSTFKDDISDSSEKPLTKL